ncbi:MAG: hypothetical protein OJJ54_14340 [Pseudonocardia sp.]|nr:hypothetical protein [Pseudonocardia sp.]
MAEHRHGRRRVALAVAMAAGGVGLSFWKRNVAGTGEHVSDVFQADVPTPARAIDASASAPRTGFDPEPSAPAALFDPEHT